MTDLKQTPSNHPKREQSLEHLSGKDLTKALFRGEVPTDIIAMLPAQSLYMAIQSMGLESGREVLPYVTEEQYTCLLDFHLWNRDELSEEHFWQWLETVDVEESLEPLGKFLASIDLKLICILITKYLEVRINTEPTDTPLEEGFYTPDRGYTWIKINLENGSYHRLFGKLLAYVFEESPERFYQLLASAQGATTVELEEMSYKEKVHRLLDEGIPDHESAWKVHAKLQIQSILSNQAQKKNNIVTYESVVTPLVLDDKELQPLSGLFQEMLTSGNRDDRDNAQKELTLIANAALVFFQIPFHEYEEVSLLVQKIRGAINIGLEMLLRTNTHSALEWFQKEGFQTMYRLGLNQIKDTSKEILSMKDWIESSSSYSSLAAPLLECMALAFPSIPAFLTEGGIKPSTDGTLDPTAKPILRLSQLETLLASLKKELS